jgi:hypothetical protein
MHPREAFKLGFLSRCVEAGLTPEATQALVKSAGDCFTKIGWGLKDTVDAFKGVTYPALLAGAAAPIALGGGAAYLANQASDTDATDVDEIKKQELLDTYRRMSDQLQRRKKLQNYKADRKRTGQVFL